MLRSRARTRGRFPAVESEYSVLGKTPGLIADFKNEFYRPNAGANRFSDLITHSRTSNATMVDSDGLIKWAPHNLLTYSEDFTQWGKARVTVTPNATTAPNGTLTADQIFDTSDNLQHFINISSGGLVSAGQLVTISAYLKPVEGSGSATDVIRLNVGYSVDESIAFDTSDQTFQNVGSSVDDYGYVDAGNGWYQVWAKIYANGLNRDAYIFITNGLAYSGVGDSFYIWGAHLYRSDLGGMVDNPDRGDSYVPTTSSAVYLPRRGHHVYNGYEWVNEGVLAESESRTNLITYSNDFTDASWTKSNVVVGASVSSPVGSSLTVSESATTSTHFLTIPVTVVASATCNISVLFKRTQGSSYLVLRSNNDGATTYIIIDPSDGSITESGVHVTFSSVVDFGDNWFLGSFAWVTSSDTSSGAYIGFSDSATPGTSTPTYTGSAGNEFAIAFAQFEVGSTPSSYIPTSGSTVTRAAETFTIPSANLPWPTPQYIGDELVTNGTFDTDSDWTKGTGWSISGGVASVANSGSASYLSSPTTIAEVGKTYLVTFTISNYSAGNAIITFGGMVGKSRVADGTYSEVLTTSSTAQLAIYGGATANYSFDNISVREINPLSVSIQMDGRMTYADDNSAISSTPTTGTINFYSWALDSSNYIATILDTELANEGRVAFTQEYLTTYDTVSSEIYSPDLNVPFNIASRHGSTFINGAVDGVALTADTTPVALPDLSTTDLNLAYDFMGTLSEFRIWDRDIGDTGIAEATKPSLEPSLSLTFDGQPSSFTNTGVTV